MCEDNGGLVRVKVYMQKSKLIKMMAQRKDSFEIVERIMESCLNFVRSQQMERGNVEKKIDNLVWKLSLESITKTHKNHNRINGD